MTGTIRITLPEKDQEWNTNYKTTQKQQNKIKEIKSKQTNCHSRDQMWFHIQNPDPLQVLDLDQSGIHVNQPIPEFLWEPLYGRGWFPRLGQAWPAVTFVTRVPISRSVGPEASPGSSSSRLLFTCRWVGTAAAASGSNPPGAAAHCVAMETASGLGGARFFSSSFVAVRTPLITVRRNSSETKLLHRHDTMTTLRLRPSRDWLHHVTGRFLRR